MNGRLVIPALVLGSLAQFFVNLPALVRALIMLNALDVLVGLVSAVATASFQSRVMLLGGARKMFIWCVVGVGWILDTNRVVPDLPIDLATVAAGYYCVLEAASILKHCVRVGVPLPDALRRIVEKADAGTDPSGQ